MVMIRFVLSDFDDIDKMARLYSGNIICLYMLSVEQLNSQKM